MKRSALGSQVSANGRAAVDGLARYADGWADDALRFGRLLLARRSNPLVLYNSPLRFFWRRILFVVIQMAVLVGLALEATDLFDERPGETAWMFYLILICAAPAIGFLSYLFYGYRHREPAHLEELSLTLLSPSETAFGLAWWPWVASFWHFAPFLLIQILAEIRALAEGERLLFTVGRIETALLVWALATAYHTQAWFRLGRGFVRPLLQGSGRFAGTIVIFIAFVALSTEFLDEIFRFRMRDEVVLWVLIVCLAPALALLVLRRTLRFSGAAFFAPIDPETLAHLDWMANERLAMKEKEKRKGAFRRLLAAVRPGCREDRRAWILATALLIVGMIVGYASHEQNRWLGAARGALGWNSLLAMLGYCLLFSVWFRARFRSDARLPLLSGSMLQSLLAYMIIPLGTILLLSGIVYFSDVNKESDDMEETIGMWIVWCVLMVVYFFMALPMLMSLVARGRRVVIGGLWLIAVLWLHFVPLAGMRRTRNDTIYFFNMTSNAGELMGLLLIAFFVLAAYGTGALAQRMHVRECRGAPRMKVTTEPEPTPDPAA